MWLHLCISTTFTYNCMDIDTLNGLKKCLLFRGLSDNEIIGLMHEVKYRVQVYKKGEIIALAGTPCRHASIVVDGEVSAQLIGPSGRVIRMEKHHSGQMLAPAFLFANDNHYPVMVEAESASRVLRLSPDDLQTLIHADQRIAMNFVHILSNIISFLTKKVGMLSMTVREKVGGRLMKELQQQGTNPIFLKESRQQLADEFGIQKYSLQRCFHEMQEEGIVRIEGKRIHVLDASRL